MTSIRDIKVRSIKGKKYFVAIDRDNKIITQRKVAGSKLSKENAIDIFRRNGSFYSDRQRETFVLKNVIEKSISSTTITNLKKPRSKLVQYFVSSNYKGKKIVARSSQGLSSREARKEALENFYRKVDYELNGNIDSDVSRGKKTVEDKKLVLRQGWVYYLKR